MIRTANLFGLKMTLTVSKISAIESTTCVTKLVFNEEPADSVVARQLEPRQLRAEPLIGCLEICTVFLVAVYITQTLKIWIKTLPSTFLHSFPEGHEVLFILWL